MRGQELLSINVEIKNKEQRLIQYVRRYEEMKRETGAQKKEERADPAEKSQSPE